MVVRFLETPQEGGLSLQSDQESLKVLDIKHSKTILEIQKDHFSAWMQIN